MWYSLITLFNTLTKRLDILALGGALPSSLVTRWRPLYLKKGGVSMDAQLPPPFHSPPLSKPWHMARTGAFPAL